MITQFGGNEDQINNLSNYVLVVDDDPAVRALFVSVFREAALEVAEAADGLEALRVIRARQPAVIVTDAQMPDMNGLQLARAVRGDARTSGAFIVMVSSDGGSTEFVAEARDAGCDLVFAKPCALATLRSVVLARM